MKTIRRKTRRGIVRLFRPENILFLVVLLLVLSFGLHALLHHEHPKDLFGDGPQAAFHGEDKKWWALFIALSLSFAWVSFLKKHGDAVAQTSRHQKTFLSVHNPLILFDPLRQALRRGIMHPKICG